MKRSLLLILINVWLLLSGCKNSDFSPISDDIASGITAYSIFDNRQNSQYVEVQTPYITSKYNKGNKNINVYLTENYLTNYTFKDTLVDSTSNFNWFYYPGFVPKRGAHYKMTISVDSVFQYAEITTPSLVYVTPVVTSYFLTYSSDKDVTITEFIYYFRVSIPNSAPSTNAVRIVIPYGIKDKNGNVSEIKSAQVPIKAIGLKSNAQIYTLMSASVFGDITMSDLDTGTVSPSYMDVTRNWDRNYYTDDGYGYYYFDIPFSYLFYTMYKIGEGLNPSDIEIYSPYVAFYSVDEYLYNSYLSINNSPEVYSVRLDAPADSSSFISATTTPRGIFSWIMVDNTSFKLPDYFINKFKYTNSQ
jgi:hypothetical protein